MSESVLWGAYLRLQERLDRRRQVDDHAWGLEAGLNRLLDPLTPPQSEEDATRTVRSASRKERHRDRLRRAYLGAPRSTADHSAAVEAGLQLRAAEDVVTNAQWAFLCALGEGHSYEQLAAALEISPASLRIRALRLRRSIRAHVPDWWQAA